MAGGGDGTHTVVTIDDEADLRRLYGLVFRDSPFRLVGEAGDGAEGVQLCRTLQPDLVLLDLSMPNMDGLEALVEVRRACPTARVMVLSGFGRDRLEPVCLELGAVAYVEKGLPPAELLEAAAAAVQSPPSPFLPPSRAKLDALVARSQQLI